MAIDVRQLQTRPLDPLIADELDIYERTLAEYLDGGVDEDVFRVFRLNHGVYGQRQGGQNQMVRVKIPYGQVDARAARDARLHRRDVLAGVGSPHDPPERAVPLRPARADARGAAPARVGRAHDPRSLRRHRAQRRGLPPRRRVPVREARHHAVGRGDGAPASCATATRSACPASSRSTSPAAPPTAARRCSTTSAWSR